MYTYIYIHTLVTLCEYPLQKNIVNCDVAVTLINISGIHWTLMVCMYIILGINSLTHVIHTFNFQTV